MVTLEAKIHLQKTWNNTFFLFLLPCNYGINEKGQRENSLFKTFISSNTLTLIGTY